MILVKCIAYTITPASLLLDTKMQKLFSLMLHAFTKLNSPEEKKPLKVVTNRHDYVQGKGKSGRAHKKCSVKFY